MSRCLTGIRAVEYRRVELIQSLAECLILVGKMGTDHLWMSDGISTTHDVLQFTHQFITLLLFVKDFLGSVSGGTDISVYTMVAYY